MTLIYLLVSVCSVAIALWIFLGPYSEIDINFHQSQVRAKEEEKADCGPPSTPKTNDFSLTLSILTTNKTTENITDFQASLKMENK